jgi:hypothetical protein
MSLRRLFTHQTPKFMLLRLLLAVVLVLVVVPPIHWLFMREPLTMEAYNRYVTIGAFVPVFLSLCHLLGWWVKARSAQQQSTSKHGA